jgi:ABC-type transport system substrate-binding protein
MLNVRGRLALRVATFLIACLTLILPLSQAMGGPAPRAGGTLTVVIRSQLITMDGARPGHGLLNGVLHQMVENLVGKDATGKIVPKLATSWEVSKDGRTWTFKLRPGVRFHDGQPLTADAVKRNFDRLLNPQYRLDRGRFYANIEAVEVADDLTISFRTKEPWGALLTQFAYIAAGILSPSVSNQAIITRPIGTGPFKFEEWISGERLVMSRNDSYWGEKAYLDRVIFREVPEDSTRVIMVERGEADVDLETAAQEIVRLGRSNPQNLTLISRPSERGLSIDFNVGKGPFKDVRLRQAFAHAINVDAIIKGVMFGRAVPLLAFPGCAEGVTGCYQGKGAEYPSYDPQKAKQLMAEAGMPNGFPVTLIYGAPRYPRHKEILTAIQGQVAKVGIRLNLTSYEWAGYVNELRKNLQESTWDATSWAWSSTSGDISLNIRSRVLTGSIPPNGSNVSFYSSNELEKAFSLSDTTMNPRIRDGFLKRVQVILARDLPIFSLLRYNISVVTSPKVQGLELRPDEEASFAKAWKE